MCGNYAWSSIHDRSFDQQHLHQAKKVPCRQPCAKPLQCAAAADRIPAEKRITAVLFPAAPDLLSFTPRIDRVFSEPGIESLGEGEVQVWISKLTKREVGHFSLA